MASRHVRTIGLLLLSVLVSVGCTKTKTVPLSASLTDEQAAALAGAADASLLVEFTGDLWYSNPMHGCVPAGIVIKKSAITEEIDTILARWEYPERVGSLVQAYPDLVEPLTCENYRAGFWSSTAIATAKPLSAGDYLIYTFANYADNSQVYYSSNVYSIPDVYCYVFRIPVTVEAGKTNKYRYLDDLAAESEKYETVGQTCHAAIAAE